MNNRRKGTTYGKALRKPVSFLDSAALEVFAQGSAADPKHGGTKTSDHDPHPFALSISSATSAPADSSGSNIKMKSKIQTHAQNEIRQKKAQLATPPSHELYDFPASDDEEIRHANRNPVGVARKRRKIEGLTDNPKLQTLHKSSSLRQRNAIEESPKPTSENNRPHGTQISDLAPSVDKMGKSKGPRDLTHNAKKMTKTKPQKETTLTTHGADRQKGLVPHYSSLVSARQLDGKPRNKAQLSLTGERLQQSNSATFVRLSTPRSSPENNASRRRERTASTDLEKVGRKIFSTPNKGSSKKSPVTTPRQAELWNRLLPTESRNSSPSHLDVTSLRLADVKNEKVSSSSKSTHPKVRTTLTSSRRPPRSHRLIDSLHASEGSREDCSLPSSEEDSSGSSDEDPPGQVEYAHVVSENIAQSSESSTTDPSSKRIDQLLPATSSSQSLATNQNAALKVTYARQRSYRNDEGEAGDDIFSVQELPKLLNADSNKRSITQRSGAPSVETRNAFSKSDEDADSQQGSMRSIHELREAGGNRRLIQELETCLEDLDESQTSSLSARRSSLISLGIKLLDASIGRLFVDQGLHIRLFTRAKASKDRLENFLLLLLMLQIKYHETKRGLGSPVSSFHAAARDLAAELVADSDDLIKKSSLLTPRMSKFTQREFENLCQSVLKSPVWRFGRPPTMSCQTLSLQVLEYSIREVREMGSEFEMLSAETVDLVIETSFPPSEEVLTAPAYTKNLYELVISMLESHTLCASRCEEESRWSQFSHERIRDLVPQILTRLSQEASWNLQNLTLRLHLNLTNAYPHLCNLYATPDVIKALIEHVIAQFQKLPVDHVAASSLAPGDSLLLSLGCLINFADSIRSSRNPVTNHPISDPQTLKPLVQLFARERKRAAEVCDYHREWTAALTRCRSPLRNRLVSSLVTDTYQFC